MPRSIAILLFLFFLVPAANAQEANIFSSIARTYLIADEAVESGDVIAFAAETGVYRLALPNDVALAGVVVEDALIVLEVEPGGLPVVASGEVMVNVSTIGGPITTGSLVGVSSIPGKGQRATNASRAFGIARETFEEAPTTIVIGGEEVSVGTIRVLLSGIQPEFDGTPPGVDQGPGGSVPQAFKYLMALLVGVGSIYISFRSFGSNIRGGIISIGRNPLAKTTIQAMVLLNIVLVVLVAGGGLLLSIAILLLPF